METTIIMESAIFKTRIRHTVFISLIIALIFPTHMIGQSYQDKGSSNKSKDTLVVKNGIFTKRVFLNSKNLGSRQIRQLFSEQGNSEALKNYNSAVGMRIVAPLAFNTAGIINCFVIGHALTSVQNNASPASAIALGLVCLATVGASITLKVMSDKRIKKAVRLYNMQQTRVDPSTVHLNIKGNGASLALRF